MTGPVLSDTYRPRINLVAFPPGEREVATGIDQCLDTMHACVEDLQSAIELFGAARTTAQHNDSNRAMRRWAYVPARDGAMTIHHFRRAMDGMRVRLCPALRDAVDSTQLKQARQIFQSSFPDFLHLRHVPERSRDTAADVAGDEGSAPAMEQIPDVTGTDPASRVPTRNILLGTKFTSTISGRAVSYDVTEATLATLRQVKQLAYGAFGYVAPATEFQAER